VFGSTAVAAVLLWPRDDDGSSERTVQQASQQTTATESLAGRDPGAKGDAGPEPPMFRMPAAADPAEIAEYSVGRVPSPMPVKPRLKRPPSAGILFDVDTGEVLWARNPAQERPIASLTKMMTALLIAERDKPGETVKVSAKAPGVEGSRIGVLRAGRSVPLRGLFLGLLMVSGNDAAVALAEHDSGSVGAFVELMNRRAVELGLDCTRFAGPAGLQDTGNSSCAYDLATLARADLANPRVAAVVGRRSAEVPFPTKGGVLHLANNHYFIQRGIAGLPGAHVTGVKTGLTNGAGRCYVTTARLGGHHLGVVLLDSPDPFGQVPALLRAGFEHEGVAPPPPAEKGKGK
jgi:D-alanyl-D-alanine carboxypeptidase